MSLGFRASRRHAVETPVPRFARMHTLPGPAVVSSSTGGWPCCRDLIPPSSPDDHFLALFPSSRRPGFLCTAAPMNADPAQRARPPSRTSASSPMGCTLGRRRLRRAARCIAACCARPTRRELVPLPFPYPTSVVLNGVDFADALNGWVVGTAARSMRPRWGDTWFGRPAARRGS